MPDTTSSASASANLGRDETADRASHLRLETIAVDLDLSDARDLRRRDFPTTAVLSFGATTESTWIDFIGAAVDEVVVNGEQRAVDWDGARIRIDDLQSENVVVIRARGLYSSSGEGLHRFRDPVDDEVYLYTQYEPADCRRVYPCFEQPDLKARWRFSVTAPAPWRILSNGAQTSRETNADTGTDRVTFAETPPLSSYITAVAAGPYHRVASTYRSGEREIALGVLCRASLSPHLDAEEILDVTRRGLAYYEDVFASSYPWGDTYDQIFVPEYNLGAMENPGLVTFTEAYIFRGASTAAQHETRANTILHEMAHMWFGDLVTMRWWDDLWLKESFADFMGTHVAARAGGYPDAWVSFASRRKGWAYEQDQLPTTHPVVADIPDLEAAKLNFDGITYAKGASLLKQLVAFVGEETFFRGIRDYFTAHAFGNTRLDDLLSALEGAARGRDLRSWSAHWLQTTGVPEIRVDRHSPVAVLQSDARPHRLGIGFYDLEGDELARRGRVEVDVAGEHTAVTPPVLPDTALIVPNDDDRTYAKIVLDDRSVAAVARGLHTIDDALARSVIWAGLWNAVRDGGLPVVDYLDIVADHAPREPHATLLGDAIAHAGFAIARYSAPHERKALEASWLETVWRALREAPTGSDAQVAWSRAVGAAAAVCADRAGELTAMLAGTVSAPNGLALDPDLRWSWLAALATTGHAAPSDADRELAADPSSRGASAHRTVIAARPDADVRRAAWMSAWTDDTLSNDHLDATIAGIRAGGRRDLIADLDDDYFARLSDVWQSRSIEIASRLVRGLFPAADRLDDVDAWLASHREAPGALRRLVIEQRDGLARALRVQSMQPTV